MHASHGLDSAWAFSEDDEEMAAQWRSLEHLSPDSLGRKVWELYQARGFAFPGTPGSAPPMLTQHDWLHVLADYGTTVESEVEVFGLIARANDDLHAFSLLAMVISLFETGYLETGCWALRALRGPLLVQPAHGGPSGRCHVPGCGVPRLRDGSGQRRLPHDGLVRHRAPHLRRPQGQIQSGAQVVGGGRGGLGRTLGARRDQPVPAGRRPGDWRRPRGALRRPRRVGLQRQDSRKRSTASTRRWSVWETGRSSLAKMLATCFSTAPSRDDEGVWRWRRWTGPRP